jgi:cell division protein FtsX
MINHQFAAWVDRTDTIEYIRDAAGNITDITNTTAATTVWPTVILTVILFAIVGFTVAYAICDSIREKESD